MAPKSFPRTDRYGGRPLSDSEKRQKENSEGKGHTEVINGERIDTPTKDNNRHKKKKNNELQYLNMHATNDTTTPENTTHSQRKIYRDSQSKHNYTYTLQNAQLDSGPKSPSKYPKCTKHFTE